MSVTEINWTQNDKYHFQDVDTICTDAGKMLRKASDRYRHTRACPTYPHVHVYLSPRANLLFHLPHSAAIRHFFLKSNVRKKFTSM